MNRFTSLTSFTSLFLVMLALCFPQEGQPQSVNVPLNGASGNATTQVPGAVPAAQPVTVPATQPAAVPQTATKAPERVANYVLGPDDQIIIHAFQAEELSNKPMQIGGDGYLNMPLVGRIKAGGLTVSELENALAIQLQNFVKTPQVTVFVSEYRSEPVSVVGAVNAPGMIQLRGRKTIVEVIALAGGLRQDAGNIATITRDLGQGRVPLEGAADDPSGKFSVAHVNLHSVMAARNPKDNLLVETNDVIMIPKAPLLYVVGEVQKPGGYPITERNSLTVLQAVALAGGLTSSAQPKKARILSPTDGAQNRTEIPTNVRKILDGQAPDVELHAEDILFVPSNLPKAIGGKALQTALNMAGVVVWKY